MVLDWPKRGGPITPYREYVTTIDWRVSRVGSVIVRLSRGKSMPPLTVAPDLSFATRVDDPRHRVYRARGSGQTSLDAVMAEEVTAAKQRFCAIDLKGDWYGLESTADGKHAGIPVGRVRWRSCGPPIEFLEKLAAIIPRPAVKGPTKCC
jgi:hypothetical protein